MCDCGYLIDEKMEATLKACGVKCPWWKIKDTYEKIDNMFKPDAFPYFTDEAFEHLNEVFHFKSRTMDRCRTEFMTWLKKHQEFYNDNLEVVYNRMKETLASYQQYQQEQGIAHVIEYINWIPQYGGYVFSAGRAKQQDQYYKETDSSYRWG